MTGGDGRVRCWSCAGQRLGMGCVLLLGAMSDGRRPSSVDVLLAVSRGPVSYITRLPPPPPCRPLIGAGRRGSGCSRLSPPPPPICNMGEQPAHRAAILLAAGDVTRPDGSPPPGPSHDCSSGTDRVGTPRASSVRRPDTGGRRRQFTCQRAARTPGVCIYGFIAAPGETRAEAHVNRNS